MSLAALADGRGWQRWGLCALLVLGAHAGVMRALSRTVPGVPPAVADAILLDLAPEPETLPATLPAATEAPPTPEPALPAALAAPPPEPLPPEPPPPEPLATSPAPVMIPDVVPPVPQAEVPLPPPPLPTVQRLPPRPRPAITRPKPAPSPPAAAPAEPAQPAAAAPAAAPAAPPSGAAVASWEGQLAAHLGRFKRFPLDAQRRGEQGVVMMRITLGRGGQVLAMSIARGSGFADLDAEAQAWVGRAAPLPPMPPEITGDRVNLVVPLRFTLR